MKKLINRIKAEENKIGKILAYYIPSILVGIAGAVEILEAMQSMPFEVPFDTKKLIAICTITGLVLGKLTKKKDV
jgi:hypothetical protein